MIARTWHGMTPASKADEYMDYLNKTGVPEYRATPGNLGVYVLRRIEAEHCPFPVADAVGVRGSDQTVCRTTDRKSQILSGGRAVPARAGTHCDAL